MGQEERTLYWVTQENLIENFVQDGLSYILITHGLSSTTLAYPKWLYVCLKANIWWYNSNSIVVWQFVMVTCNVMLNSKFNTKK